MTWVLMTQGTLLSSEHAGQFLAEYDPDHDDGRGRIVWVEDPDDAIHFENAIDALQVWRMTSVVHPWRDDGKPNRPLTAHTVEPMRLEIARARRQ